MRLGHLARRRIREVLRPFRGAIDGGPSSPQDWWDNLYATHPTFTASGHFGIREELNELDFEARWEILRKIVERYRQASHSRLLDAGCGNGLFTKRFVELGFEVTAFDISGQALKQAKRYVGDAPRWERAPVESFRSSRPYDFVVCTSVLMCIVPDEGHARAVRNLASVVAAGGYLIIEELLVPLAEMGPEPTPSHRVRFRALELYEEFVRGTNLELVEHVRFHTSGAQQDKCFLVFTARDRSRS